jgi:hypothetical protein
VIHQALKYHIIAGVFHDKAKAYPLIGDSRPHTAILTVHPDGRNSDVAKQKQVGYWHKADMLNMLTNVRYRG